MHPKDLEALMLFHQVALSGGMNRAADQLQIPKATVSRKIARLEDRLGCQLLKRGTRRVVPTESGYLLDEYCDRIFRTLDEAVEEISNNHAQIAGSLRICMPQDFWILTMPGMMCDFANQFPELRFEIQTTDESVDVTQTHFDVVIHVEPVKNKNVPIKRIGVVTRGYYASPSYLRKFGLPTERDQLINHECIVTTAHRSAGFWQLRNQPSKVVDINGRFEVGSIGLARELILRGMGIGIMPDIMCIDDLKCGRLVRILHECMLPSAEIVASFVNRHKLPRRTRVFLDFLATQLLSAGRDNSIARSQNGSSYSSAQKPSVEPCESIPVSLEKGGAPAQCRA